ncbi:MAG: DUF3604 domain-containing protein [Gammaproteobacteria bacterium]|nr:DUF3604 domain-containing protein [Gammaproteobacteria bacterium]
MIRPIAVFLLVSVLGYAAAHAAERQLLWGDTHLHTNYSFDAFLNNNLTADPDTAYRWAKGQPVIHPFNRTRVRIDTPLDFLVVSDHAELMGALRDIYYNGINQADAGILDRVIQWYTERTVRQAIDEREGAALFVSALPKSRNAREAAKSWAEDVGQAFPLSDNVVEDAWRQSTDATERHYEPGKFTALVGWEWSSIPGGANLHRVVFTDADAETAQKFLPFASTDSPYPEDLWQWLETTANATGAEFMSIPHNSNISKGFMFDETSLRGAEYTAAYAQLRAKWERVVEVTQIKGDSEAHPQLSPDDEFADFESYPFYIQQDRETYRPGPGDFARSALKRGLGLEAKVGTNPYQFGMIGSTDSHTGLSSAEEPNFWGKMATDSIPENKASFSIAGGPTGWTMSASGLAAVWADANTREAIMAAFKRREVYATTGSRIRVQLFAGWQFSEDDLVNEDFYATGTSKGVPMGGELEPFPGGASPSFVIIAQSDPRGANLDRIQVVKGWLASDGADKERIYNVAWSDDRALGSDGRLPAVGNTVDLATGRYTNDIGATELSTVWTDPEFDPSERAFYYVRVLEIPTPRHGLLDALALGESEPLEGPATIQERAYTSPVWYSP